MSALAYEINKIPPVTRFLCGSSLGITLSAILQFVSPYKLLYVTELAFKKFEVRDIRGFLTQHYVLIMCVSCTRYGESILLSSTVVRD